MTLRAKLALALAALSALAAMSIGAASYRGTASSLRNEIDAALARGAEYVEHEWEEHGDTFDTSRRRFPGSVAVGANAGDRPVGPSREFDGLLIQILDENGEILREPQSGAMPVDETDRSLAAGERSGWRKRDVTSADDDRLRVLTVPVRGGAVQLGESLNGVDAILRHLIRRTLLTVSFVAATAGLLGWWFARRLTARLVQLTRAAEHVASTGELAVSVPAGGSDEAGRLGTAIDRMLGSLASSRQAQRRLVQDAGHELRTPLTSLRTNISVLRRNAEIPADQRDQLLADLDSESRELTTLVDDLLDAASDRAGDAPLERTELEPALRRITERAGRRSGRHIRLACDSSAVDVPAGGLDRMIGNLLDNALKFDGSQRPIEVTAVDGEISVRDHGGGFDDVDLPHVFERFYRSTSARSRAGSGLGLSIVRDIATRCGGSITAENHPDGGAIVRVWLPPSAS